jgi:glycosyltransferase involved in cell wall biosynthesis
MRIVHVQLLPLLSGVQRVCLEEMRFFVDLGHEVVLIVKENGPLSLTANEIGVKVIYCDFFKRELDFRLDFKSFLFLYRFFKVYQPDIVHSHSSKTGVLSRFAARMAGVKRRYHTVHGFSWPSSSSYLLKVLYWFLEFLSSWLSTHIFAMNANDLRSLKQFGIPINRFSYLPNGVSLPLNIKRIYRDDLKVKFLFVGRFWEQKDPMFILESLKDLTEHYKRNVSFTFVGDGPLRNEMLEYQSTHLADCDISILGWSDNVYEFYTSHDVLVMSSKWEGMPLVLLEAMSYGLCIIGTRISGISDVVEDRISGLLYEPGDCEAFGLLIELIVDRIYDKVELGNAAREQIERFYTQDKHNYLLNLVYKG